MSMVWEGLSHTIPPRCGLNMMGIVSWDAPTPTSKTLYRSRNISFYERACCTRFRTSQILPDVHLWMSRGLPVIAFRSGVGLKRGSAIILTIISISWEGRGWITVGLGYKAINSFFQSRIILYHHILINYSRSRLFFISMSFNKELREGYGFIIIEMPNTISQFRLDTIKELIF